MLAFASLIIDNVLQIEGFRIVDGAHGVFVSPPQKQGKDKEGKITYFDDIRFLDPKAEGEKQTPIQKEIYKLIADKYRSTTVTSTRTSAARAQAAPMEEAPLWE